jgi:copper(I)-binding protein
MADGTVGDVIEIPIQFEDGGSLTLKIPVQQYAPEYVKSLVDNAAQQYADVAGHSGIA